MTDQTTGAPRKKFVQFQPSGLRSPEECEDYYRDVHTVWAMKALAASTSLVSYETNRVERQWDLLGGFDQPPDHWRFAILRETGSEPLFTAAQGRALAHDHRNFLRELRRFDVEETSRLDRPSMALSSVKYLVVLDRPDRLSPDDASSALGRLVSELRSGLERARGGRRLVANRVLREHASLPGREPGQLPTNEVVATERLAFLELWFDDPVWGQEFFAAEPVRDLLTDSAFAPDSLRGYQVTERVSHDRRPVE